MDYPMELVPVLAVVEMEGLGPEWVVCFYSDGKWWYNLTGEEVLTATGNLCGRSLEFSATVVSWIALPPIPSDSTDG